MSIIDNKTRDALYRLIDSWMDAMNVSHYKERLHPEKLADAILGSRGLRVELVDRPRYEVDSYFASGERHWRVVEVTSTVPYKTITQAVYFGADSNLATRIGRAEEMAREYCIWLNSKESK
jgi:hypothetical protein